jgi:hypothetical protein
MEQLICELIAALYALYDRPSIISALSDRKEDRLLHFHLCHQSFSALVYPHGGEARISFALKSGLGSFLHHARSATS